MWSATATAQISDRLPLLGLPLLGLPLPDLPIRLLDERVEAKVCRKDSSSMPFDSFSQEQVATERRLAAFCSRFFFLTSAEMRSLFSCGGIISFSETVLLTASHYTSKLYQRGSHLSYAPHCNGGHYNGG